MGDSHDFRVIDRSGDFLGTSERFQILDLFYVAKEREL